MLIGIFIYFIYSETSSTQINVEDYIDSTVTRSVLSRQLLAVDTSELERNGGLTKLTEFVRESFHANFDVRDNEKVKSLDYITKNLRIPSRSGRNIGNDLNVNNANFPFIS